MAAAAAVAGGRREMADSAQTKRDGNLQMRRVKETRKEEEKGIRKNLRLSGGSIEIQQETLLLLHLSN